MIRRKCLLSAMALIAFMLVGAVFASPTITQLAQINVSSYSPSISGDGTKVAFQSDMDGDFEIFLWEEENGTGEDGGADSGLNITTIAIIAAILAVSITAALYLIIRGRRSKQTEKHTTRGR